MTTRLTRDDGLTTTIEEIEKDVVAAQAKYASNAFCFTALTVKSLLDHIRRLELRPNPWTIFWNDGTTVLVYGTTFAAACGSSGLTNTKVRANMAMMLPGVVADKYSYNMDSKMWSSILGL